MAEIPNAFANCRKALLDRLKEAAPGRFDAQSLRGLLEFCRRHPAFKPLVITAPGDEQSSERHGVESVSWEEFLIAGPPGD